MSGALLLAIFHAYLGTILALPNKKIFIGALVPSQSTDEGFRTAIEYATEMINNRSDILKDYKLVVKYANSCAHVSTSHIIRYS